MDPNAIIDSYVADVVRYLPRRQRADVALELRSLLDDELGGRAADAGRPADSALAMELLTTFGTPQEVADRYRPAGFTIIRPSDAPRFTWITLGGVALIWAITLPAVMLGVIPVIGWDYGADAWWGRLTVWWLGPGIGALWWPGVVITYTLIGALVTHRRESEPQAWTPTPPRMIDRDLISRPGTVVGIAAGALGATLVIALPWLASWAPWLPEPAIEALALDPEFLQWRAPWVLLLWAAELVLYVLVLFAGRWSVPALRARSVLSLAAVGLLLWWSLAGLVFVSPTADSTARILLGLLAIYAAVDAVIAFRRSTTTSRTKPSLV
ncbi:HAAS signaling domain-containing protein [Microbacterium sp. LWH12-1.2]|uniref:HAAS signaling domain-containing protein n=1 Tax=Microbacterium sp. LWH12-1.2 TaxID=3135259 RepID=UPI00343F0900